MMLHIALIGARWVKWGLAYGILCDKNVSPKLKCVTTCGIILVMSLSLILGNKSDAMAGDSKE